MKVEQSLLVINFFKFYFKKFFYLNFFFKDFKYFKYLVFVSIWSPTHLIVVIRVFEDY